MINNWATNHQKSAQSLETTSFVVTGQDQSTSTNTQMHRAERATTRPLVSRCTRVLQKILSAHRAPYSLQGELRSSTSIVISKEMDQWLHLGDTSHLMLCLLGACLHQDHGLAAGKRQASRTALVQLPTHLGPNTLVSLLTTSSTA